MSKKPKVSDKIYDHSKAHFVRQGNRGDYNVKLSFGIDFLYSNILASKQKVLHDKTISKTEWKMLVLRFIDKLDLTIKNSVVTDYFHSDQINFTIEQIKESCKDFYTNQPNIIAELIRLSFLLVGEVPNLKGQTKHEKGYKANMYRTVKYEQNIHQKVNTIIAYSHIISKFDEFSMQYSLLSFKDHKFIDWVKSEYPSVYCKLF